MAKNFKRNLAGGVLLFTAFTTLAAFQNCAGGFATNSASSSGTKANTHFFARTTPGCTEIRWKFLGFKNFNEGDIALFGAGGYQFGNPNVPFIRDPSLPPNFGSRARPVSYVLSSKDCGMSWTRLFESVSPMMIDGPSDRENVPGSSNALNGPDHFAEDPNLNWFNRGFVSRMNWGNGDASKNTGFSVIYPVFWETDHWAYQLATTELPQPIIGDNSRQRKDGFYSPAVVPVDDEEKSALLYFGGWRSEYSRTPVGKCADYNRASSFGRTYEAVCKCDLYDFYNFPIDACTGDKIFVSTNARSVTNSANKLDYRVYQGSGLWSPNGRDSSLFEPVVSGNAVNKCHDENPQDCPFIARSVNDPTVVKTHRPDGSLVYVMYFTVDTPIDSTTPMSHTYVATSSDGLWWNNYHALRGAPGVRMPGGTNFNDSNGGVRAFAAEARGSILITTDMTGDDANTDQSEKGKQFLLRAGISEPWNVVEVRGFQKTNNGGETDPHALAGCTPGQICDTTHFLSGTSFDKDFDPISAFGIAPIVEVGGNLSQISVSPDGTTWGLNAGGYVYRFDLASNWWASTAGQLDKIQSANNGAAWGLDKSGRIFFYNPVYASWRQIGGSLTDLSVASDGTVWGVNSGEQIFRWNQARFSWDYVEGYLKKIYAVNGGGAWGLNSLDEIYRFNSSSGGWDKIPGSLHSLSISEDGAVWGLNSGEQIFRFDSITGGWIYVQGSLRSIEATNLGSAWGLNANNNLYHFNTLTSSWDYVPTPLAQIATSANGTLWGLAPNGSVWKAGH